MLKTLGAAVCAALALGATVQANAAEISGAGATFPAPVYAKWAEAYKARTGVGLNYQAIGSGGGIKQIQAKTVAFGASDKPLKPDVLDQWHLYQFPTVMGGVVPALNIPGVPTGSAPSDGRAARRHLSRQDRQVERPKDRGPEPRAEAAEPADHHRPPFGRLGHQLPVYVLPVDGEPRV